ncbi:MAG: HupE/UreJ family protein [Flavobacteriaceae bacterium]
MDTVALFFELGWWHVLDVQALDHLFFIAAFTVPYTFRDTRRLLVWTTLFTIGHTLSLIGNFVYQINPSTTWVEFFIPLSIVVACLPLLTGFAGKMLHPYLGVLIFLFGIVHGFGFSRYFGMIVPNDETTLALFSFALGVEGAQIIIILGVLLLEWLAVRQLTLPKEKWKLITGAMIVSQAFEMTVSNWPF